MYDVIVVGVGGMGSAAVYDLAKRGKRVLGLERFNVPHAWGSSHGVNRIIRLAYHEHPSYVPLLHRAYELWRELEQRVGEQLLYITGSIDAGPESGEVFQGSFASCLEHRLPHEVLDSGALTERFPGYRLPAGYRALYQEQGGFLLSERCIVGHVRAAQALGAEVRARERVQGWRSDGSSVTVETDKGQYQAEALVITAGAWAAELTPELRGSAQPERQVLGWFQPRKPERFSVETFPVFNLQVPEGHYYGFPVHGVPGFKIGRYHHLNERVEPHEVPLEVNERDEAVLRECTRRYFPDADGPTMALTTCRFTNTPDMHFVIGQHPQHANVTIAAGFSGHGYKFCSVVGEIVAELAVSGKTRHDISLFSPERFMTRA